MNNFREEVTVKYLIEDMKKYVDVDPDKSFCVYGKGFATVDTVSLESICFLDEYSDYDDDDNEVVPIYVSKNKLELWFSDEIVQQVVISFLHQNPKVSNGKILEGIFHYYKYDVFMNVAE